MRFGLLCPPGLRADAFIDAAVRRGHPAPVCLSYDKFLRHERSLKEVLAQIDVLRLDSPGGGYEPWKAFAEYLGAPTTGWPEQYGRIYPQFYFFNGLNKAALRASELSKEQGVKCTFDPQAINTFMDKKSTYKTCAPFIDMPKALPEIETCEDLETAMGQENMRRAFLKIRYGSSASGVLAIEKFGTHLRVWTTVEKKGEGLFNSLKIKRYLDAEARAIINDVAAHGVQAEAWIPKFRLGGKRCDLRLLMVDGKPAHCVARCSSSPITNLHLGNERVDASILKEKLTAQVWNKILYMGSVVASLYKDHLCLGMDIAIHQDGQHVYLLDVNCFGDQLNDVYHDGLDSYEYQIACMEQKFAKR